MAKKNKSNLFTIVISLTLLFFIIYAFSNSDFSKLKKYDQMSASSAPNGNFARHVKIRRDNMLDLGDFEINVKDNKKLITNISAKFKSSTKSWNSTSNRDITRNGVVIRNTIIETILNKDPDYLMFDKVKLEIIDNINRQLVDTKIEEIYFNEFIVQ